MSSRSTRARWTNAILGGIDNDAESRPVTTQFGKLTYDAVITKSWQYLLKGFTDVIISLNLNSKCHDTFSRF